MRWSRRLALACLALLCALPALAADTPAGEAPRPWRVGVVREWLPIDGIDAQGRHTGATADILAAAAASLGRTVVPVPFDDYNQAIAAARAGEVDLLSSISRSPQREAVLHFTQTVLRLPVVYITRRDTTDFSEANDFGGRSVAVERGYPAQAMLRERFPAVRRIEVDSTAEALRAVAAGRADVYRGTLAPAHYAIEREQLTNLRVLAAPRLEETDLAFASGDAQLAETLDGALRALGPARIAETLRRWQPVYLALAPAASAAAASATPLRAVDELRVAYDAGFAPISHTRPDGSADGLAVEVFRRSAAAAGLPYRFVAQPSFAAAIQALRRGDADVVVAAVRTPERLREAQFVGPYYSTPSAIISRLDGGWPTLSSLAGRALAIDEEHYLIPVIRREAPAVRLNIVPTAAAVLAAVADGRADAGITNVEVAAGLVATRYVGRLQVSGFVEKNPSELYFMVGAGRGELAAALDAGFARVPENERRMLANSLLRTNINVGIDWRPVALVVVPLLVGLTVLWLTAAWSARRLRASESALRDECDRANAEAHARADFVADMSHEVRTPLVALAAGLRLLDQQELPAAARRVLGPLLASAHRLVELLNTLLDMARLEAGKLEIVPEPTDVATLVASIASAFEPLAAAKGVALRVHADPPLPVLMLDPQRTLQVVNNLVANAVKFTEHGEVTVTLRGRALGDARWELTLAVRDTGPGMSAAVRERLFGRFVQAPGIERHKGGSGLGLAIARQLVERADGSITLSSEPGRGSEFVVVIRTREAHALAPAASSASPGRAAPGLLLVDDDAVNLLVFAEQLRARGFAVETARGADEARALLAQRDFDVLVTDFDMGPGASGAELAADLLRRRHGREGRAMRVFVLSGDEAPDQLPGGVDAWLNKPRHADDRGWLQNLERSVAA